MAKFNQFVSDLSTTGKGVACTYDDNTEREVFVETGGLYGPWPSPKKHSVFCVRKNNKTALVEMDAFKIALLNVFDANGYFNVDGTISR
jgi:hypothetical protein